jgi:hypothetical protein
LGFIFFCERTLSNIYKFFLFNWFGINKETYLTYFDKIYKKRIGRGIFLNGELIDRYAGFRKIFEELLDKKSGGFTIIETGVLRKPGKWIDGQSSLIFYEFLNIFGGKLISIDLNEKNLKICDKALRAGVWPSGKANLVLIFGNSLEELKKIKGEADLLYLDSYDLDIRNPEPAMAHHLKEVESAAEIIKRSNDLLIAVDDNFRDIGKGKYVREWAQKTNKEILLDSYQIIIKASSLN